MSDLRRFFDQRAKTRFKLLGFEDGESREFGGVGLCQCYWSQDFPFELDLYAELGDTGLTGLAARSIGSAMMSGQRIRRILLQERKGLPPPGLLNEVILGEQFDDEFELLATSLQKLRLHFAR